MAKLTAWLVTIIGLLMLLGLIPGVPFSWSDSWVQWILTLLVLAVGISKLVRNYSKKRRR